MGVTDMFWTLGIGVAYTWLIIALRI